MSGGEGGAPMSGAASVPPHRCSSVPALTPVTDDDDSASGGGAGGGGAGALPSRHRLPRHHGGGGGGGGPRPRHGRIRSTSSCPSSPLSTPTPSLHGNMMQRRKDKDPFVFYEVVKVLGSGSMGSVSKVRKRRTALGGTARKHHHRHHRHRSGGGGSGGSGEHEPPCFHVPVIGGLFRACFGARDEGGGSHGGGDLLKLTTATTSGEESESSASAYGSRVGSARSAYTPSSYEWSPAASDTDPSPAASVRGGRWVDASASASRTGSMPNLLPPPPPSTSDTSNGPSGTVTPLAGLSGSSGSAPGKGGEGGGGSGGSGGGSSSYLPHHLAAARLHGGGTFQQNLQDMSRQSSVRSTTSSIISRTGSYEATYALKSIRLDCVADDSCLTEMKNEIDILKTLDHPNIVKPIETFERRKHIYLVIELCSGGDLYTRDPYTEDSAAKIMESLLGAVSYMHGLNIIHRDLKYENVMFANTSPRSEVKLIDFGLSKKYGPGRGGSRMHEGVGTIYTMAPEVIQGDYTSQADVWSLGVIAYMLLSSQMPFYGKRMNRVVNMIMKGEYDFSGRRWGTVSSQAKEFVSDLLQVNPDDRPTAEKALRYSWLNRRFATTLRKPKREVMDSVQETLENYANYGKLKKLALMVIAHKSTSAEIGNLRKVWETFDVDKDGSLSLDELRQALSPRYSDDEIESIFIGADLDGDGKICYSEFLAASIEAHGSIDEERFAEAFDRLDTDNTGYISTANLSEILGKELPRAEIEKIIDEADLTHEGKISYDDFLDLWRDGQGAVWDSVPQQDEPTQSEEACSGLGEDMANGGNKVTFEEGIASASVGEEDSHQKGSHVMAQAQFSAEKAKSRRKRSAVWPS